MDKLRMEQDAKEYLKKGFVKIYYRGYVPVLVQPKTKTRLVNPDSVSIIRDRCPIDEPIIMIGSDVMSLLDMIADFGENGYSVEPTGVKIPDTHIEVDEYIQSAEYIINFFNKSAV